MLMTLICLKLVIAMTMAHDGKLNYVDREEGWNEGVKLWGEIACRTGRTRVLGLHEIARSAKSRRLKDFFGDLVLKISSKCLVWKIEEIYHTVNSSYHNFTNNGAFQEICLDKNGDDKMIKNLPVFIEKSDDVKTTSSDNFLPRLLPQKDLKILVLLLDEFVGIMMNCKTFRNLHHDRHVIILVITKKNEETSKLMVDTFVTILQKLWKERGILNIFLVAPLSKLGHLVWFYDPFVKNATTGSRGQVFALRVSNLQNININRVKNLQGYTLNIGMFEHDLTVINDNGNKNIHLVTTKNGFSGIDALTMNTISRHMNFNVNIVPPTDGIEYGYVSRNGTCSGTLSDLVNRRIDISFNGIFAQTHGLTTRDGKPLITFTMPIDFDRLCIVVPRALKIPRWLRTFHYYHPAIWACLAITQILVTLVWYYIRKIEDLFTKRVRSAESCLSLFLATFFLIVGAPMKRQSSQIERILLVGVFFFGITIIGTFTGTLYDNYTNELYYNEISSLKQLDDSGMPIVTVYPRDLDFFGYDGTDGDPREIVNLRKKLTIVNGTHITIINNTAYKRKSAVIMRKSLFRALKYVFVDENDESLLHLISSCPRSYYVSYMVPIDSIYLDRFSSIIDRLMKGGFPQLWNTITINGMKRANRTRYSKERAPFNFTDVQTSFWILAIGHLIAICVFIAEMRFGKKRTNLRKRILKK